MAKETRDIKQYKLYTLYALVTVVIGKDDAKEDVTRGDREAFALFDDRALLDAFTKNSPYKLKGQTSWEIGEEWVEYEPTADRFGLPLNPSAEAPKEETNAKDNGSN